MTNKSQPETPVEPTTEANVEPTSEVDVEPKLKATVKPPSDLTPQIVKQVHELYEELGRKNFRAVEEWEKAQQGTSKDETTQPDRSLKRQLSPKKP